MDTIEEEEMLSEDEEEIQFLTQEKTGRDY